MFHRAVVAMCCNRVARRAVSAVCVGAAVLVFACGAAARAQQHAGSISPADVEAGARLYAAQCAPCHGSSGNQVAGVDLARGNFRSGTSDEALARTISEGIPGTAMRAHTFSPQELSALIAFLRTMTASGALTAAVPWDAGDPIAGRTLVEGKGRCLTCHRINADGARRATNLSDIGLTRTPEAIHSALVDPLTTVAPGIRFIRATTADGRLITGRRLNEDSFTVQLLDDRDQLVSLVKAELRDYSVSTTLPSPPHVIELTPAERRDIASYLASLKGLDPIAPRGGRQ